MFKIEAETPQAGFKQLRWRRRAPWIVLVAGLGLAFLEFRMANEITRHLIGLTLVGASIAWVWGRLSHLVLETPQSDAARKMFDHVMKARSVDLVLEEQRHTAHQRKVNAGTTSSVQGIPCSARGKSKLGVRTTGPAVWLETKDIAFGFSADSLISVSHHGLVLSPYRDVEVYAQPFTMHLMASVPSDTEVVGTTWEKVNASGGRDKRYKDNRKVAQCAYGRLHVQQSGLPHIQLDFSNRPTAEALAAYVQWAQKQKPTASVQPAVAAPQAAPAAPSTPIQLAIERTFGAGKGESKIEEILVMHANLLDAVADGETSSQPNRRDILEAAPGPMLDVLFGTFETTISVSLKNTRDATSLRALQTLAPAYLDLVRLEANYVRIARSEDRPLRVRQPVVDLARFFVERNKLKVAQDIRTMLVMLKIPGAEEALGFVSE